MFALTDLKGNVLELRIRSVSLHAAPNSVLIFIGLAATGIASE